jgi:hypothetical protein
VKPADKQTGEKSMPTHPQRHTRQKLMLVLGLAAATLVVAGLIPPIAQDPAYHLFADQRTLLGIPHFWDTLSNLAFLVIGGLGAWRVMQGPPAGGMRELRTGYLVFFLGVALIAAGSGYYHLQPTNERLVWDRLPMAISLMAFFSVVVGERIDAAFGRRLLWPLVVTGIAAVVYWGVTEAQGSGDLRPYVVVQFLPVLLIPIILVLFPSRLTREGYLWATLLAYPAAKAAELLDAEMFHFLGVFSGHTLKHLLAAAGAGLFLLALQRRTLILR